jgi:hypothetical protein
MRLAVGGGGGRGASANRIYRNIARTSATAVCLLPALTKSHSERHNLQPSSHVCVIFWGHGLAREVTSQAANFWCVLRHSG